jgi:RHS repeat-associated protein
MIGYVKDVSMIRHEDHEDQKGDAVNINRAMKQKERTTLVRSRPGSSWNRTRSDVRRVITSSPPDHYVDADDVDEPILRHTGAGVTLPTTGDNAFYYHRNQQYSIIGLTNAAGTLVERYTYTAYGTLGIFAADGTVRTISTYANRYTYTGREYDADLNLYHFRARWYDPATGVFISRDPLGYVDGMSLYREYFGLGGADPLGLLSMDDPLDAQEKWRRLLACRTSDKTQCDIFSSCWMVDNAWDFEKALDWSKHHAQCMRADGNQFGYNLHMAWLANSGKYTPTEDDIDQVRRNTEQWFQKKVQDYFDSYRGEVYSSYCSSPPECPKQIPISITGNHGSDGTFVDDDFCIPTWGAYNFDGRNHDNMYLAYGGYRFKLDGTAYLAETTGGVCRYNVCVSITMEDSYAFGRDPVRRCNPYYSAGSFLELIKRAKAVDHTLKFETCFTWQLNWVHPTEVPAVPNPI